MRHAAAGRTRAVYARGWPAVMHMPPLPPPLPPGWKCKCIAEVAQQRHPRLDPMRRQCITSHPPAAAKTAPHPVSRYLAVLSGGVALYLLSCHHAHRCRPTRRSHPKRQPHRKRAGQTPFPLSLSVSHAALSASSLPRCGQFSPSAPGICCLHISRLSCRAAAGEGAQQRQPEIHECIKGSLEAHGQAMVGACVKLTDKEKATRATLEPCPPSPYTIAFDPGAPGSKPFERC